MRDIFVSHEFPSIRQVLQRVIRKNKQNELDYRDTVHLNEDSCVAFTMKLTVKSRVVYLDLSFNT